MYSVKHCHSGILKINGFFTSPFFKNKKSDDYIVINDFSLVCAYVCVIQIIPRIISHFKY